MPLSSEVPVPVKISKQTLTLEAQAHDPPENAIISRVGLSGWPNVWVQYMADLQLRSHVGITRQRPVSRGHTLQKVILPHVNTLLEQQRHRLKASSASSCSNPSYIAKYVAADPMS